MNCAKRMQPCPGDRPKRRAAQEALADIDKLLVDTKKDLEMLHQMETFLCHHFESGNISFLHYTVDQEQLKRTVVQANFLLSILSQKRERAVAGLTDT